ncbi:MAG: hypothetical protein ACWGQW_19600 [bacterium]
MKILKLKNGIHLNMDNVTFIQYSNNYTKVSIYLVATTTPVFTFTKEDNREVFDQLKDYLYYVSEE